MPKFICVVACTTDDGLAQEVMADENDNTVFTSIKSAQTAAQSFVEDYSYIAGSDTDIEWSADNLTGECQNDSGYCNILIIKTGE